jgi:menaquinol-cytochrome c reductase cytochrome b/c subunit
VAHGQDPNEKVVYVGDSRVRKKTKAYVPQDYSAYPGKSEAFVPNFLLKEWMVGAVVLVGYMALVIAHPSPLGYPADPNNADFIPMPDWYFLFLYQLLKYPYVADQYVVLGSVIIPGIAFCALAFAPFLDTTKERKWYKRPVASAIMFLTLLSMFYLTKVAWDHYQHELEARNMIPEHILREMRMEEAKKSGATGSAKPVDRSTLAIVDENSEGHDIYLRSSCVQCHAADMKGMGTAVPALRGIGDVYSKEEIVNIIRNGYRGMAPQWEANLNMGLTEEELDKLTEWLALQKAEPATP